MESCQLCYSTDNWGKGGHCTVQLALKQQPAWIALENRNLTQAQAHSATCKNKQRLCAMKLLTLPSVLLERHSLQSQF